MNKIKKNEEISVTNGSVEIVRREVQEGYPRSQRVLPNGIFCQEVMLPNESYPMVSFAKSCYPTCLTQRVLPRRHVTQRGLTQRGLTQRVLPKASFTKKDSSYINELR